MPVASRIVVKLGLDPKQFKDQLRRSERSIKNFAQGMETWGRKASMVSLPVAAAGAAAVKVAADYETSMMKIKTLVGINAKQVDDWGKQIIDLGGDLSRGPNELAEALFFVTSAGLRSAKALDVVTLSAKASVVGLGNTAVVAKLVVSAMQAYTKTNLTAKDSVDALMATVRFGNVESEELAGSMGRVLGIAASMGVSIQEAGAFVAAYTRVGVDANIATTALRATLSMLLGPGDQARNVLKGLGVSVEGLHEKIAGQGLAKTLVELANAEGLNVQKLDELVPNIRALAAVLAVAKSQAGTYLEIAQQMNDKTVDTNAEFARSKKTAEAVFASFKGEMEAFAITVGTAVMPTVIALVLTIKDWAESMREWSDESKKQIAGVVALIATLGPLAMAFGIVVSAITPGIVFLTSFGGVVVKLTKKLPLYTKAVNLAAAANLRFAASFLALRIFGSLAAGIVLLGAKLVAVGTAIGLVAVALFELATGNTKVTDHLRKEWDGALGWIADRVIVFAKQVAIEMAKVGLYIARAATGWDSVIGLLIKGQLDELSAKSEALLAEFIAVQAAQDAANDDGTGSSSFAENLEAVEKSTKAMHDLLSQFGIGGMEFDSGNLNAGAKAAGALQKEIEGIRKAKEDAFDFTDARKDLRSLNRLMVRSKELFQGMAGDGFDISEGVDALRNPFGPSLMPDLPFVQEMQGPEPPKRLLPGPLVQASGPEVLDLDKMTGPWDKVIEDLRARLSDGQIALQKTFKDLGIELDWNDKSGSMERYMDAIKNLELGRQAAVKHAAAVKESLGKIGESFADATKEAEEFGATTGVEKFQLKIKTALQGLKENLKNIFSGDTDLGQEELTALANRWGVASDSINTYEEALALLSPAMLKILLQSNPVLQELQEKFKTLSVSVEDSLDLTEAQKFFREVSRGTKEIEGLVAGLAKIDPAGLRDLAADMGLVAIDGETVAALANRIGTEWTRMLNSLNPAIDSAREMVKQLNIDLADAAADTPMKQMVLDADRAAASFRVMLESMEAKGNTAGLNEIRESLGLTSADIDEMVAKFRTGVVNVTNPAIDGLRGKFSELQRSITESLATTDAEKFAIRVKESSDEVEALANAFAKVDEAGFRAVALSILDLKGKAISTTEAVKLLAKAMTDGMNQMHPSIQSAIGMVDAMNKKLEDANATTGLEKLELVVKRGASAFRELVESIPEDKAGLAALDVLRKSLGTTSTEVGVLVSAYSAGLRSMEEDSKTFKINVGEMLAGSMTQVFTGIARGTREAKDILKGFQDFTINVFGQMFSEMLKSKLDFDAVWEKNWLEDIPGAVKSGMESVGEFVLQTMQLVVNAIGAGLGLDWNLGGGRKAPAGTAARVDASAAAGGPTMELATGGITTGPRLAMVGDNPSGTEAIIPLERWKEVMGGAGGGGGTQVVIHAPTALVSQKRKQDSQGREMLEFIFEGAKNTVASDIMNGGAVSQAMESAFGAKRGGGR